MSIGAADVNGDGRLEIMVTATSTGGGWFEAFPFGDYDRNGRVDVADRSLAVQHDGETASPPGSGADGNRDGHVDSADVAVVDQRLGDHVLPRRLAANSEQLSLSERIDGRDFLHWQRQVGRTSPGPFITDWDLNGITDRGDLLVWTGHYGAGLTPNGQWIGSGGAASAAMPGVEPAIARAVIAPTNEKVLPNDTILSLDVTRTTVTRSSHVPLPRQSLAQARDAALVRLATSPSVERQIADARTTTAKREPHSRKQDELVDAAFASSLGETRQL
jgi:hypothetical protein